MTAIVGERVVMRSVGAWSRALCGGVTALAIASASGCQKAGASATPSESGIVIRYEAPASPDRDNAAFLRKWKVAEEAAEAVDALVDVDRPVSLVLGSCGGEGSAYDPEADRVEICYDEVSEARELFQRAEPRHADDDVAAVMLETLFHETAHALVDVLGLRTSGREEDFADQFAALMLLRKGVSGERQLLAAAEAWRLSAVTNEDVDSGTDEHSSDSQRAVNHLCYVYGSASGRHQNLVGADDLPADRAKGCAREWSTVRASWMTALGPHLREE
ncbi:DUF4344 domain-containing metallopeptidase [Streptomyces maoxianensis]|uniref:DUF4344 domain-containing metallopeptidase n=1 Tax=Streptomyces maoxianensis TaxID=1459942 RepID=A0ABV9G5C7_9ACTN